jgi:heme-degrading monooxygenase HmoA
MIIREWRGRALRSREGAYPEHFNNSVLPHLKGVPGFIGAQLCCRPKGDLLEFVVLTRWESFDAIRAFAGQHYERAVVEPAAAAALIDFDPLVQHYEILTDVSMS